MSIADNNISEDNNPIIYSNKIHETLF